MRRGEEIAALLAVVLAAAVLVPLRGNVRFGCGALAVLVIAVVLVRRLRVHNGGAATGGDDTSARIARIREQRRRRR